MNGSIIRQHHCRVAADSSISRLWHWPARLCCAGPLSWHIYATQFSRLKILLGSPSLVLCPSQRLAMALFSNSKQHNVIIMCNECDKVIQKLRLECDSDNHQEGIKVISSPPLQNDSVNPGNWRVLSTVSGSFILNRGQ